MRSSLSCEFCRRSKIKCVNSGTAPCQKCGKLGRDGCELTRPHASVANKTQKRKRGDSIGQDTSICTLEQASPSRPGLDRDQVGHYLTSVDKGTILKALGVFTSKFPELRILQPSLFMKEYHTGNRSAESKALLAVMLASVKKQPAANNEQWAINLPECEKLASYARDVLSNYILEPPKIIVVQALLILTLFEWGVRDFHKARMHCGIAVRIMQSIHSFRVAPFPLENSQSRDQDKISAAVEAGTYWACFIMDCTINSGIYNPRMLPKSEMKKLKIARAPTLPEFAFGSEGSTCESLQASQESSTANDAKQVNGAKQAAFLDITSSPELMVEGFDINAQIMAFVFNDGRRGPGMCAPENCPWAPGSPWNQALSSLEQWRASQHPRLHYPENSVATYMLLGLGESFVYLNILYYHSVLMLHREYFPFLPSSLELTPRGPIDPPFLEAEAPAGWWDDSALKLFGASESIARIMKDAKECGIQIMTPFSGFCAFSACLVNLFVYRYPRMNYNRSPGAKELTELGIDYLREFQHVWDLGAGWLKTIQNSSHVYERATCATRPYRGKTRYDFEVLHRSIHEYRAVDRSDQHLQQIQQAERDAALQQGVSASESALDDVRPDQQGLRSAPTLTDLNFNLEDSGQWPNWWSLLEEEDCVYELTGGSDSAVHV